MRMKTKKEAYISAIMTWIDKCNDTVPGKHSIDRIHAVYGSDLKASLRSMTSKELAAMLCCLSACYNLAHHDARVWKKETQKSLLKAF